MLKTTSINPSEGIQQMFWKGLAREKDVNCDDTPLDDVVFQILVETLPSAEVFNNFGLPIQLASLLPRLIDKYMGSVERNAALQASKTILNYMKTKNLVGKDLQAAENLEMIFRFYAEGDYKQGEVNWLGAVCKYLHELSPESVNSQLQFFLSLLDSRDCPIWLCSASAASIRFLLQHCSAPFYPPQSLSSVVKSLSKIVQQYQKKSPQIIENSLAALQSIVGRASVLFSAADSTTRPNSPLSNLLPGRVLEFEVDYDHKEEERKQIVHWKRNSTGREVRKKLRNILQNKPSTSSSNGFQEKDEVEKEDNVPDEMKHFDFLYYDSITSTVEERDYLYDIDIESHDKFKVDSAHDTEKEEKDDFAGHGAIIDLRPGQNVSDDEDEDEPKKIKKKKKQKKPIEEDSSDTSNKSTRRTRPSSMPDISSNQQDHYGEMELPWSATLPISPALRSQWQSLLDKNDVIGAVNLFPTIWNSLRVSCSWIVNNQLPKKNKALTEVRAQFQDIVDMVNRLQPAQFFASSSRVFKSSAHKKLNLKILALSESLDQFALSDNHVRNCIELINAEDAQKNLEFYRLLYKLFYQLDCVFRNFHQVTDLLASSTSSSAINTTRDLIGKYYNPIVDLFNDNKHLYEFNIADLRIEELVQLITEKDFMFLKMKIENNGDKQGESPNPYPLSYLTKASFDYLASLGPEDHFAQIDSQQENHDSISEQLMAINQLISAELRQKSDRIHSTSSSSSNSIETGLVPPGPNTKRINNHELFSRSLNATATAELPDETKRRLTRRTSF